MALTPEDVVNKRFQPTKFREGYDQDEVDDFLDEVVVELRRLNQENEELRQRLVAGESRINDLQSSASQPAALAEAPQPQAPAEQPQYVAPAPVVAAPAPVPVPAYSADQAAIDSGSTNNLLQLARKLHEEHVREGIEKRDALIGEGNATAARVVGEAEATAAQVVGAAKEEAATIQRDQIAVLDRERQSLEGRIEELRTFEREYRQKLKGYIEGQLRELDATQSSDAPQSAAAPAAGNQDAPYEAVSASSASADSDSHDSVQAPPSFQGFGGN